jgi:hypothetical protein
MTAETVRQRGTATSIKDLQEDAAKRSKGAHQVRLPRNGGLNAVDIIGCPKGHGIGTTTFGLVASLFGVRHVCGSNMRMASSTGERVREPVATSLAMRRGNPSGLYTFLARTVITDTQELAPGVDIARSRGELQTPIAC